MTPIITTEWAADDVINPASITTHCNLDPQCYTRPTPPQPPQISPIGCFVPQSIS
ncbi:MAG: hypothetical protein FWB91_00650 [Defluviitaleaceae bacterium]|nr:hypothetical protein [Defluviitaleaceae bacterium]